LIVSSLSQDSEAGHFKKFRIFLSAESPRAQAHAQEVKWPRMLEPGTLAPIASGARARRLDVLDFASVRVRLSDALPTALSPPYK
jgi:hypothetical protein